MAVRVRKYVNLIDRAGLLHFASLVLTCFFLFMPGSASGGPSDVQGPKVQGCSV